MKTVTLFLAACCLLQLVIADRDHDSLVYADNMLLSPRVYKDRAYWNEIGRALWEDALAKDITYVIANTTTIVSVRYDLAPITPAPSTCGNLHRQWIRLPFHDCGTYNLATKQYGCNGSLRKELVSIELTPEGVDIYLAPLIVKCGDRVDADWFNFPTHPENFGFTKSASIFYNIKLEAEDAHPGFKPSWADVMVYGSLLALYRCGGPKILFHPGRIDSPLADPAGLLPSPITPVDQILEMYARSGFSGLEAVVLGASHTTACFASGCLDSTPDRFDGAWAAELLQWDGVNPPMCPFAGIFPLNPISPQCKGPMDIEFLRRPDTNLYLRQVDTTTELNFRFAMAFDKLVRLLPELATDVNVTTIDVPWEQRKLRIKEWANITGKWEFNP